MTTIAIDVMSGDRALGDRVDGVLRALQDDADLHALLVGAPDALRLALQVAPAALRARTEIVPSTQVVAMDEPPREAIRHRKDSSMRVAIDLVKAGRADGCVSAGNTGALTAMSHFVLKTVGGVERAAMMSAIPAAHGLTHMLDLGANSRATAVQLYQFGVMGSIVASDVHGIPRPRVGLLNIGEEGIKGNEIVKAAHVLLASSSLAYVGFVEGGDIFSGGCDVVVTDGFTGNVALKTMEGVARLAVARLAAEFDSSVGSRLAGWLAQPVLRRTGEILDPRRYNGACMVGLAGVVVKSHGHADALAFTRAVALAARAVRSRLTELVSRALEARGI